MRKCDWYKTLPFARLFVEDGFQVFDTAYVDTSFMRLFSWLDAFVFLA